MTLESIFKSKKQDKNVKKIIKKCDLLLNESNINSFLGEESFYFNISKSLKNEKLVYDSNVLQKVIDNYELKANMSKTNKMKLGFILSYLINNYKENNIEIKKVNSNFHYFGFKLNKNKELYISQNQGYLTGYCQEGIINVKENGTLKSLKIVNDLLKTRKERKLTKKENELLLENSKIGMHLGAKQKSRVNIEYNYAFSPGSYQESFGIVNISHNYNTIVEHNGQINIFENKLDQEGEFFNELSNNKGLDLQLIESVWDNLSNEIKTKLVEKSIYFKTF